MKTQRKIPTILGIIVLLAGIAAGVGLTQYSAIFRLRAAPDERPNDVRITNVTDTSFTISWTTGKPTLASVNWDTTTALANTLPQADPALTEVHSFVLSDLNPSTTYFFKIQSGGTTHDNNGIAWQARTGPTLTLPNNTQVISGTIKDATGAPAANTVVYITSGTMASLSAKTSSNGNFVIPLALARSADSLQQAQLTPSTTLQVLAQAGTKGVATAQVLLSGANPIPAMTLGQTYDFRSSQPLDNNVPQSQLNVPNSSPSTSRISLDSSPSASSQTKTVTLKSVTEGEIITTDDPEFFGDGPPGTSLTITVESDPQSTTLSVPSSGSWKWNPPKDLPAGTHKITISWKDASGILRQLTRSFVVSAQEGPSFESSPSASTPTPTATPTPSPTPVVTLAPSPIGGIATPSPTATATASPRVSIPATDSGTPVAGIGSPTLLMLLLGFMLISISFVFATKG